MPAAADEQPRLRIVDDASEDAVLEVPVAPPVAPPVYEEPSTPVQPALQTEMLKALAFEAAIFGVAGATAGLLAATAKRRPRGALLGSMGGVGVFGLSRAALGGAVLPTVHRVVLGVLGAALLGGSGYLAFFHKPSTGLGRLPAPKKGKSKRPRRRGSLLEE